MDTSLYTCFDRVAIPSTGYDGEQQHRTHLDEVFWHPFLTLGFPFTSSTPLGLLQDGLLFCCCSLKVRGFSWTITATKTKLYRTKLQVYTKQFYITTFSLQHLDLTWSSLLIAAETSCHNRSDSKGPCWSTATVNLCSLLLLISGVACHNVSSSCIHGHIELKLHLKIFTLFLSPKGDISNNWEALLTSLFRNKSFNPKISDYVGV